MEKFNREQINAWMDGEEWIGDDGEYIIDVDDVVMIDDTHASAYVYLIPKEGAPDNILYEYAAYIQDGEFDYRMRDDS